MVDSHYGTIAVQTPDGEYQHVLSEYNNRQEAAKLMASVKLDIIKFLAHLKTKYHIDETDDQIAAEGDLHRQIVAGNDTAVDIHKIIDALLDNYNYERIFENRPGGLKSETSVTINKGEKMYYCMRDIKNKNKLIDKNTLMFVILHEISHIANYNGWDHTDRFWTVFAFILHEAVEFGIYTPVDYKAHPINYCGLDIGHSPYYDETIRKLWLEV